MTRLKVDLDLVEQTGRGTRFQQSLAVLIGTVAVLAALLALIQTTASQQGGRASLMAIRLAAAISERIATSQVYTSFQFDAQRSALVLGISSTSRVLTALEQPDGTGTQQAIGEADQAASDRFFVVVTPMTTVPADDGGPLDPHTAEVVTTELDELQSMLGQQSGQRTLAADWSGRSSRAVLGLTLLALAGVLAGLTAILGEGRAGRIALGTAGIATAVAAIAGVFAVV